MKELKIYTAAPFKEQAKMRKWRKALQKEGFIVTSRWLEEQPSESAHPKYGDNPKVYSVIDLIDVEAADAFLLDATEVSSTGGKHFETGYAYALNKKIVIVGEPENVFHFLPAMTVVKTLKAAIKELKK